MAISIQDQQRIFLAYRALFAGQNAQVRQAKTIRKILISSKTLSSPLVQKLGLDKVVSVLKELLQRKVFSSELKAKLAFPVLYETSPEQNARHEASDVGAAKEEAEALQEVEALDNAVLDGDGAGVFEFEETGFEEESKLPAAVNGCWGPVSDIQCEMFSFPQNLRLKQGRWSRGHAEAKYWRSITISGTISVQSPKLATCQIPEVT